MKSPKGRDIILPMRTSFFCFLHYVFLSTIVLSPLMVQGEQSKEYYVTLASGAGNQRQRGANWFPRTETAKAA
jgi:hypothetical protein